MAMRNALVRVLSRHVSAEIRPIARRWMNTASGSLPEIEDGDTRKALKHLYAINWYDIDDETRELFRHTLSKSSLDDPKEVVLLNSWRAALAVEEFYDTLETLRMQVDTLMGVSGEATGPLPEKYQKALEKAHSRYVNYLASFGQDEQYLKKKVEVELGSMMILLKQRCSGLDAKWGEVGLIGTSGLSGSYIEKRE